MFGVHQSKIEARYVRGNVPVRVLAALELEGFSLEDL